jgi:23S rRNA (cytosine1962-C5)-methyltransferase
MNAPGLPQVSISARAATRLRGGHVWVYASDVTNDGAAQSGALVHVVDHRGQLLGSAVYSSSSQIKLRLLTRERLDSEADLMQLVRERLAAAIAYRDTLVKDSNACRLIFSEADLLPGLVLDRYNDVYTFQVLTQAWDKEERKQTIVSAIRELTQAEHIVERSDERIRELEQLSPLKSGVVHGSKSATVFSMNGVSFHYNALAGQKTGGFLDQRENYAAAAAYGHGTALDVCTYHGGFALHLARVCEHVTAIDVSREALEVAEQNENSTPQRTKMRSSGWKPTRLICSKTTQPPGGSMT